MTREEIQALAALAKRLGTTPRHVLLRAAIMSASDQADASENLRRLSKAGTHRSAIGDDCCNLLLTSAASYAKAGLVDALDIIRQDIDRAHA